MFSLRDLIFSQTQSSQGDLDDEVASPDLTNQQELGVYDDAAYDDDNADIRTAERPAKKTKR